MIRQKIRILDSDVNAIYFTTSSLFTNMNLVALVPLPAWLTVTTLSSGFIESINLLMSPPPAVYTFYFTTGGSPSNIDAILDMEIVIDELVKPLTTCNNSNAINIVWLTREGGRASYIFDQRKNFGTTLGESKTYDNNGTIKYFTRGKNFNNKTIYKTGLSIDEVNLIESLRWCIQAWEYNETTDVSTPILFDPKSFDKFNTKFKLNEVTLTYRLAEYKIIQSQ